MASGFVTKEIESRLKQIPEHIFEVFLEIHQPINNGAPEILIKYPNDFTDHILKTAADFAYPYLIPPDDRSENFTFVVLDSNGSTFRFGYCRRSNRESTCLCLISYYPWFEVFYSILNDLSQMVNAKSENEVERFLSSLYNYKLMLVDEFHQKGGKELIKIANSHQYSRPDLRRLPSMLSNLNYTILFSQLNPDLILRLFAHLIFERRILFISSKLFHLTACACACLHLITPMHWQSLFLPILPESMTWTTQCMAPYIIGIHTSIYAKINKSELGDVILVNIDERTIQSPYDDLSLFPKYLIRQMRKDIQQSIQSTDDQLARIFLRAMAVIIGDYANGFIVKNEKLDFDRKVYLEHYLGSDYHRLMSLVANTQMFEQFSRYRAYLQLQRETDIDEFDIEVKNLKQSKKPKSNGKIFKLFEKRSNPPTEQVQTVIQKPSQIIVQEVTNNLTPVANNDSKKLSQTNSLIDFDTTEDPVFEIPMVPPQESKIKQLQNELQSKFQTFETKRPNPRDEYTDQQKAIKQLVQQFDPLDVSTPVVLRPEINISDRHPSLYETISSNRVNNIRQNFQTNPPMNLPLISYPSETNDSNLIVFN